MLTADQLSQQLAHYYCSDNFYQHTLCRKLVYTDGVKFLADGAEAYWLIDLIASYQHKLLKHPRLREEQFWTLKVDLQNKTAVVTCLEDKNMQPAVRQEIKYTDFPLPFIKLNVSQNGEFMVLMLPSER